MAAGIKVLVDINRDAKAQPRHIHELQCAQDEDAMFFHSLMTYMK